MILPTVARCMEDRGRGEIGRWDLLRRERLARRRSVGRLGVGWVVRCKGGRRAAPGYMIEAKEQKTHRSIVIQVSLCDSAIPTPFMKPRHCPNRLGMNTMQEESGADQGELGERRKERTYSWFNSLT
jgi:hypothetical protein